MTREQIEELAIQYSTEGLSEVEEMHYEVWLSQAADEQKLIFSDMVDLCSQTTQMVALSVVVGQIPETIRLDLLHAIAELETDERGESGESGEILHITKDQQDWINLPIKNARMLELSARKSDGFAVSIIDLKPGGEFPEHDHHGVEMAYILEGDLEADGVIFQAGDFFRADPGSHHGKHTSPSGCQALIITANENYKHKSIKTLGKVQKIYRRCKNLLTS